jgi:segregation and condensation protein A
MGSIVEKIALITTAIRNSIKTRFSELIKTATNKVEVVVSFLAMLELMKQRSISADQADLFAEIEIAKLI